MPVTADRTRTASRPERDSSVFCPVLVQCAQNRVTPIRRPAPANLFGFPGSRSIAAAISFTSSLSRRATAVVLRVSASLPMGKLILTLTLGSAPTAFVFATIGAGLAHQPIMALAMSYLLSLLLLPIALYLIRLRER